MNTPVTMHFTIEELYASATAKAKGIDNKPPIQPLICLVYLAAYVLEPLRDELLLLVVVLLLRFEVCLQVSSQLLIAVLYLLSQLGVGLHRLKLCLFSLGLCCLGF